MLRPPPRSTRPEPLFPFNTLFRSPAILQCWSYVPQFLPPSWTEEMTKSYAISAETQSYLGETINQPIPARFRGKASDRFPNRLSPLHADRKSTRLNSSH